MSVIGRYVATFAEASHALPDGMHMNADYPFMLPRIARLDLDARTVTLTNGRKEATFAVESRDGVEFGYLEQSSTFERMFGRKPTRFKMMPFKDSRCPSVLQSPAPRRPPEEK